ncbi:MAG: DUF3466 family protein [Paraglaciecola sp.]|nr:DUF3466 family protein [Paraglaciecola sp.]
MKKTRLAVLLSCTLMTLAAQSAQYKVVELPTSSLGQSTFPTDINNSGNATVNVQNNFNPVIDVSLINFELQSLIDNLTDIEAAKAGQLNDEDYLLLYTFVTANRENQTFQQIAQRKSYVSSDSEATLLPAFDLKTITDDEYDGATTTIVRAINDFGYTVGAGQGGFYQLPFTFEDESERTYVLNDFYRRAFAQVNDNVVALLPPDVTAGGLSEAFDINNNNQVVGTGTTAISSTTFQTSVDNCLDDDERGDIPAESCLRALSISLSANPGSFAQRRGLIWQLDAQGNVVSTKTLGLLDTPADDDVRTFSGSAVAINDNGIAVGEVSTDTVFKGRTYLNPKAAFYIDDQILTINSDSDNYSSTATGINNDDIAVGFVQKQINGVFRRKMFVHDINTDVTSYPTGFFLGSSTVPMSINNNGLVVGYGEIESSISSRRNEAFLYDTNNDTFMDIGSLLACDSAYLIQAANGINDDNEIVATALKKGKRTNIKGEVVLDSDGAEIETDVVVAVKLIPIDGGSVEQCEVVDDFNKPRQGAGSAWLLLLGIFGFGLRRFKFKS